MCPKLQRRFKGPFKILERVSDVLYRVQLSKGGSESVVHFNRLKPYVACSVSESMGQDNQSTPVDRTVERHPEVESHAGEHDFVWGYHQPAAPEAVQTREKTAVSSIEGNPLLKSSVEDGLYSGNLHPAPVDTGLGEMQQESGCQRREGGGSLPELCLQRIQPARSRRPPAWSKDYNLM